mmetsp:Transcript_42319/g.79260  ORF Transcript_42319/g.79260 Transcript_42319/m.79260 type:complete len:318 (+) Transcript_42319:62-1015(+)
MPPRFEIATADTAGQLKDVLKTAGKDVADGDVLCYNVTKKEDVSGKKVVVVCKSGKFTEGDAARKMVGLPPSGGKSGTIKLGDIPAGGSCFVQSTSHNRKVPKMAQVLVIHAGSSAVGTKRKASAEDAASSVKRPAAASSAGSAGAKGRIATLLAQFKQFGEVGKPTPESKIPADLPPELREMFLAASQWSVQKNSCGVFGLNFFEKGSFIEKVQLFGDEDLLADWAKEHKEPNVATDDWECIAAVSEFDFIFVNVNKSSKNWGATRIITNNCFEDKPLCPAPFSKFLDKVDKFVQKYLKHRETEGDDWEDDPPMFR